MKLNFHNVWWWVLTIIGWGLACIHWTNFKVLQWRNRLAHGTYRQYKELCRGCEFEPHLEQQSFLLIENEREKLFVEKENISPRPGIEPGPSTWQAEILTTRLSRNRWLLAKDSTGRIDNCDSSMSSKKVFDAVGRIRTYAPRGKLISSQSP